MRGRRYGQRIGRGAGAGLAVVAVLSALTAAERPGGAFPLLVTQLPADPRVESRPADELGRVRDDCREGARIVRVDEGDRVTPLTDGFVAACDPDVSFDGERMLFAGLRRGAANWGLYEMRLDDGAVRPIVEGPARARMPVYQGSLYTIDRDEPWYQITFVGEVPDERNEFDGTASTSLFTVALQGGEPRRITYNPSSDSDPTVLPDGRLLFASWQRATLARGPFGRIALFAAQTDGPDYALFAGDEGRRIKRMPAVLPDRRVLFVESDVPTWDGAGAPASVSLRRNLHSYRTVPAADDALYHSPSPLGGGSVLVSRRPADGSGDHALGRLDLDTGAWTALFDTPGWHEVQARRLAPRPEPDGRSSVVNEQFATGRFYALDVFESDLEGKLRFSRDEHPRLRVLEGLPGDSHPRLTPTRILGEIDVEPDGSFNVEVPADVPIQLQLIDEQGMARSTCGWIWVRQRETRGCIGCHEDPERTPDNLLVDAVRKESVPLLAPVGERRTVDFERGVAPVLVRACAAAGCHGPGGAAPRLDGPDAAWKALAEPEEGAPWVRAGRAADSRLIDLVRVHPETVDARPSPAELRALIEWIDLGASRSVPRGGGAK